jgi:hypothetical protein
MYWEALNVNRTADFEVEIRREAHNILLAVAGTLGHQQYRHISSKWRWIGWDSVYSINFMANFLQFVGTTIFWIGPIAWLPGTDQYEIRCVWTGGFMHWQCYRFLCRYIAEQQVVPGCLLASSTHLVPGNHKLGAAACSP